MGAIDLDIVESDGTHDIPLLPQDARAALNGIQRLSADKSAESMAF